MSSPSLPARGSGGRPPGLAELRAAAYPPTKKKIARVWKIHDAGARAGRAASGLASCSRAPDGERVSTSAVTSQWPRITPAMASARSALTLRSRPAGVAASMRAAMFRMARRGAKARPLVASDRTGASSPRVSTVMA